MSEVSKKVAESKWQVEHFPDGVVQGSNNPTNADGPMPTPGNLKCFLRSVRCLGEAIGEMAVHFDELRVRVDQFEQRVAKMEGLLEGAGNDGLATEGTERET